MRDKPLRNITLGRLLDETVEKYPENEAFVDKYPMTASGKVQKYKLREMSLDCFHKICTIAPTLNGNLEPKNSGGYSC